MILKVVVDLVTMKALYFDGENGETIREEEIPANLKDEADEKREELLDAVSMFSEELMEVMLEEQEIDPQLVKDAVRAGYSCS